MPPVNLARRSFCTQFGLSCGFAALSNVAEASKIEAKFLNITSFGAVGDGETDSTQAIQHALRQLADSGGVLHFPAGVYIITKPLKISVDQNLRLSGKNAVLKFTQAQSGFSFILSGQKQLLGTLSQDAHRGSQSISLPMPLAANAAVLLQEGPAKFISLNMTLEQIDSFSSVMKAAAAFFRAEMVGKNLVNSQDGATFYIQKVIDPMTAMVVAGNNQFKTVDLSLIGQWAVIDLWCKARSYYVKGEFLQPLKFQNKLQLTLAAPLLDSYAKGLSHCWQIYSGKLVIDGLSFQGSGQNFGLKLENLLALKLANLQIDGFVNNGLTLSESMNIEITNLRVRASVSKQDSNYAGLVSSCQNVTINNAIFSGGFHALSHGGTFPCRNLRYTRLVTQLSSNWSLDFHGNCSTIWLNQVRCSNGAYIGGINCQITNSLFSLDDVKRGALVFGPERDSDYYQLSKSQVINTSGNALIVANQFVIQHIATLSINYNFISAVKQSAVSLQAYPYGPSPVLKNLIFSGNQLSGGNAKFKLINNHNKFQIISSQSQLP